MTTPVPYRPGSVAPDRALAHIGALRLARVQDSEVIAQSGVTRSSFYRLLRGNCINELTERRILSVPLPAEPVADARSRAGADSAGAAHRLQALMTAGWPLAVIAAELDRAPGRLRRVMAGTPVFLYTDLQIRALYDRWHHITPEDHGVPAADAEWTRIIASMSGWTPPAAVNEAAPTDDIPSMEEAA